MSARASSESSPRGSSLASRSSSAPLSQTCRRVSLESKPRINSWPSCSTTSCTAEPHIRASLGACGAPSILVKKYRLMHCETISQVEWLRCGIVSLPPVSLRTRHRHPRECCSRLRPDLADWRVSVRKIERRMLVGLRRQRLVFDNLAGLDRKSTPLNSSHTVISYSVFFFKKKKKKHKSISSTTDDNN